MNIKKSFKDSNIIASKQDTIDNMRDKVYHYLVEPKCEANLDDMNKVIKFAEMLEGKNNRAAELKALIALVLNTNNLHVPANIGNLIHDIANEYDAALDKLPEYEIDVVVQIKKGRREGESIRCPLYYVKGRQQAIDFITEQWDLIKSENWINAHVLDPDGNTIYNVIDNTVVKDGEYQSNED